MSILGTLATVFAGKGLESAVKSIDLGKVLEVGTKWIPDEKGKVELEKAVLETNLEIIKSNKGLLENVVRLTFPSMCWIFGFNCFVFIVIGTWTFCTTGQWVSIPINDQLFTICKMFLAILGGKWFIKSAKK